MCIYLYVCVFFLAALHVHFSNPSLTSHSFEGATGKFGANSLCKRNHPQFNPHLNSHTTTNPLSALALALPIATTNVIPFTFRHRGANDR